MPLDTSVYYNLYQTSLRDTFVWKKHENIGYPTHFHSAIEIYYILDGEMDAEINGTSYCLQQGDIAVVNPFEIHTYPKVQSGKPKAHVAVLIVGETFLADFFTEYNGFILPSCLTDKEFNKQVLAVLDGVPDSFTNNESLSTLAKKAYVNLIIDKIISRYGLTKTRESNKEIANIVRYIYENYTEELTLDILSKKFNYSCTSISRLLSKYLKTDLRCFVNNLRVEQANMFISSPKFAKATIMDIALRCGFKSTVTFYRSYKRRYGHAPRKPSDYKY